MWWLLLFPVFLFGQSIETDSMLFQAEAIARHYAPIISKQPPPETSPQTDALLRKSSNWLIIDLHRLETNGTSPLSFLNQPTLWQCLSQIGFDAVEFKGLKGEDNSQVSLQIDPTMGTEQEYKQLASMAINHEMNLIGSLVGSATGNGIDFALALKNIGSYPGLYSLIEIPEKDWPLLPPIKRNTIAANIPWLMLRALADKGYVPQDFTPYVKESDWNATEPIRCIDQTSRRWIYLRDAKGHPRLNWLNPTFASERLAAGDILQSIYHFGQPILQIDAALPENAQETLTLLIRKAKGYSALLSTGGVASFANQHADVQYDHLMPMAALHALMAEDAEMLRLTARLFLEEKIAAKQLIHSLEPFGRFPCDWAELLSSPKKKYQYAQEQITGEVLRTRLLREDKDRLAGLPVSNTWMQACSSCVLSRKLVNQKREQIEELRLLLAKFFAWQPGVFALSAQDLLGVDGPFSLLETSIAIQLKNGKSFSSQLQRILRARREIFLERAHLVDVPSVDNPGVVLFRYRLAETGYAALLAVNFAKTKAAEVLESSDYVHTNAIDLYTGLSLPKTHESSFFIANLEPYTAQLILFQPKIYP